MKLIRRGDIWPINSRPDGREGEAAQVEAMRAAHASRLIKRLGHVPDDLMSEIDAKIRMHLGL